MSSEKAQASDEQAVLQSEAPVSEGSSAETQAFGNHFVQQFLTETFNEQDENTVNAQKKANKGLPKAVPLRKNANNIRSRVLQTIANIEKRNPNTEVQQLQTLKANILVECLLNAYIAEVSRNAELYHNFAERYYTRHGPGCINIQLFSIEDATQKSRRFVLGLSATEMKNAIQHAPFIKLVQKYNHKEEFVVVVSIAADSDERGWYCGAVIKKSAKGEILKAPIHQMDQKFCYFNYDPNYVSLYQEESQAAKQDFEKMPQEKRGELVASDLIKKDIVEHYVEQKQLETVVFDYLKQYNIPERKYWIFISRKEFEEQFVLSGEQNYFNFTSGMDKLDYQNMIARIELQDLLINCQREPCPRIESEPMQFAEFECKKCNAVVYCSAKHRKEDAKIHKKECANLSNLRRRLQEEKKNAKYNQTATIEF